MEPEKGPLPERTDDHISETGALYHRGSPSPKILHLFAAITRLPDTYKARGAPLHYGDTG